MKNPYTTSTHDSLAYKQMLSGRTDDLAKILDHIALNQSIALFGERRIGKTSLLFLIRDILNDQIHDYANSLIDLTLKNAMNGLKAKVPSHCTAIYMSLQNISRSEPAALADELHQALCDKGIFHTPLIGTNTLSPQPLSTSEESTITNVFRALYAIPGDRLYVILLDEMEGLKDFADGKQIARNLRSVIQAYPRICMVLAGAEEWHSQIKDKTSPLVHNVHTYYLKAPARFPIETYLVKELLQGHLPPTYESSDMVRTIMLWTESKAFYVQAICGSIVEKYSEKGLVPDDWKKEVVESVFESTRPTLRDFYVGNNLDALTKNILILLANKPGLTTNQVAVPLASSKKTIGDKISDLVSLNKVSKQGAEYHVVGTLIETWGRENLEIPITNSTWSQRPKWIVALVFILSYPLTYFYTHPDMQMFSFTISGAVISIQEPSSLEQNESGKVLVSVRNTSTQSSISVHVFLNSSTIEYQLDGTNQLTFQSLAPGERKSVEATYRVNNTGNNILMTLNRQLTTQMFITQDKNFLPITRTFSISQRPLPLQQYWLLISSLLTFCGLWINAKDLQQLLVGLLSFLQKGGM